MLKGSDKYVVRDVTDIDHPFTASTWTDLQPISGPGAAYEAQLVGPFDVSYYDDQDNLVRRPLAGSPTIVTRSCAGIFSYAWSSDGRVAAYVTDVPDYSGAVLHLVAGGQDRAVGSMRGFLPTGCESREGCEQVGTRLLFSPDGAYLSLVSGWPGPSFHVWNSDGSSVVSDDAGMHAWSVWSGDTLYFRTSRGVETWRDGQQSLLLPGVAWVASSASPGGRKIVYQVRDSSGTAHVDLLDTATGKVTELKSSRSYPAFLTSRYVWYEEERPCRSGDPYGCPFDKTIASGTTFIYDLQTGTESQSIISAVSDVWPHPA